MGSRSLKVALVASAAAGIALVSGIVVAGMTNRQAVQLESFEAPAETLDEGAVNPQPLPAGDQSGSGRPRDDESGPAWRTNEVRLGRQEAEAAALERFGDARVLHAEVEEEDGYFLWEVFLQRADGSYVEVFVDAADGRVLGVDHEGFDD